MQIRQRGMGDKDTLVEAVEYIRTTWPYWDRYGGARHFVIHTGARLTVAPDREGGAHFDTQL